MGISTTPATWQPGETPTAAKFNIEIRDFAAGVQAPWDTYAPSYEASVGNGSLVGAYLQVGKTMHFRMKLTAGSSTSFAGGLRLGLPLVPSSAYSVGDPLGQAYLFDNSASVRRSGTVCLASNNRVFVVSSSDDGDATVTPAKPWTWGSGDILAVSGVYELG